MYSSVDVARPTESSAKNVHLGLFASARQYGLTIHEQLRNEAPLLTDRSPRKIIVLFDIDGTLLYTGGAGSRALNNVFRQQYGIDDAFYGIRPHGMTDPAILRQMIHNHLDREPEAGEIDGLAEVYCDLLEEELRIAPGFTVLPGAVDLLECLGDIESVLLGLSTGNLSRTADLKLRHVGLETTFSFGGFGSDSEDRCVLTRTALNRGRLLASDASAPGIVIGDTIHDVRAGLAAGARCLGVMTSGTSRQVFEEGGAHLVLEDLTDQDSILEFLLACTNPSQRT